MSNTATVTLNIDVRQEVEVNVHIGDIVQAINELPLSQRVNTVATLVRNVDTKHGDVTAEHLTLMISWLEDTLSDFKDTLHVKQKQKQ